MIKPVASLDDILHRGDWCAQLQQAWYQHIPLSEKMGVRIQQYTGQKFITTMPEAGKPESAPYAVRRQPVFARYLNRMGAYLADAARAAPGRHHYSGGCAYPLQPAY